MRNKLIFLIFIMILSNSYATNNDFEEEWQIVEPPKKVICKNGYFENYDLVFQQNDNKDLDIKIKAACNTALTLATGAGMYILQNGIYFIEKSIEQRAQQFQIGAQLGSRFVGNLYGQGTSVINIYENEKNILTQNSKK